MKRLVSAAAVSCLVLVACDRPADPVAPMARGAATASFAGENVMIAQVKAEHLAGVLPIGAGLPVEVRLHVDIRGTDLADMTGEARHFATTGAHNYWSATGSVDGSTVRASGVVTESNTFYLIGSPVSVTGDVATGDISMSFGPLAGGPFRGKTLQFSGSGVVSVELAQ